MGLKVVTPPTVEPRAWPTEITEPFSDRERFEIYLKKIRAAHEMLSNRLLSPSLKSLWMILKHSIPVIWP